MTDLEGIGFLVRGEPVLHRDLVAHALLSGGAVSVGEAEPSEATSTVAILIRPIADDWEIAQDAGARVVVVVDCEELGTVVGAVARGAQAVIHHDTSPTDLRQVVGAVVEGNMILDPTAASALTEVVRSGGRDAPAIRPDLTHREREILSSIASGESVKQTSRALGIAAKTVENIQGRLFRKLGVRNRAQAVARAETLGLLSHMPL